MRAVPPEERVSEWSAPTEAGSEGSVEDVRPDEKLRDPSQTGREMPRFLMRYSGMQ